MPVSTRLQAPNYKIFEPDALDQIYAKGNLDPIMGGISYAFGNAHKQDNLDAQQQSLAAGDKFNKMAQALDAMEIESKTKQEALKIGGKLMELGEDPTKILGSEGVYANPADNLVPGLMRGKLQSEINKNNASASADRTAGKESETYQETYQDPGSMKTITRTYKGKPGGTAVSSAGSQGPNIDPKGSTPIPKDATASQINQIQTQTRAKAVAGPDATILDTAPSGHTIWGSKTTGKTATFDSNGKQVR